ncbi:MAG: ABC transporter ATP-binding protein [Sphaerobacter sp.]|nr:ABC transporter ATP-binding protein [Sphaerobacter sp.]
MRAVDGVSLTLGRGEILGLIGPNGSGKTTLINVLTGMLRITDGEVWVGGTDIAGWTPHRIARAGVVRTFQVVRLFKAFSVLENVEVAALSARRVTRREAMARAWAALERVGLDHLAEWPAGALPQGEERRVEIARALASAPEFLLLDEPGAELTEPEVQVLLETLAGVRRELGCGILIVDHDMRLIMRLCDRLHVLNYGRTIAEGTPDEVRREPDFIAAYLGAAAEAGLTCSGSTISTSATGRSRRCAGSRSPSPRVRCRADRRQWCRQEHHAGEHRRDRPALAGSHHVPGTVAAAAGAGGHRPAGDQSGPRGAPHLPRLDRGGEPAPGRRDPERPGRDPAGRPALVRVLPPPG